MNTISPKLKLGQRIILDQPSKRPGKIVECLLVNEIIWRRPSDTWCYEYKIQWDDTEEGVLQTMFYPTIVAASEEV